MAIQFLFDPQKLKQFSEPFYILTKKKVEGKTLIKYGAYSTPIIKRNLQGKISDRAITELSLLSKEKLQKQENQMVVNYHKVKLRSSLKEYVNKHLSKYYYQSFRKLVPVINTLDLLHKVQVEEKRYRNSLCSFDTKTIPKLSFRLRQLDYKLFLDPIFELDGTHYTMGKVKRFQFLLRLNDRYYFLRKQDWQLLEVFASIGTFTHRDFIERYHDKLKRYQVETSEAFTEEIRRVEPDTTIQVSELSGNLLLFLPRWNYDGTTVDDDKSSFVAYEDQKKVIYQRHQEAEDATMAFLRHAHPNFENQTSFYLTFKEASRQNWFFKFYHNQLKDNFTITGMDMLSYFRYSEEPIHTEFRITRTIDNEVIGIFKAQFGQENIPTKTLQKAILKDEKHILLRDNSLGVLTEEWLQEYGLILKYSKIEGNEIRFAKWILLLSKNSAIGRKNLAMILPEGWLNRWEQWNQTETIIYPQPSALQATLRNYQQKGYEWFNLMAEINAGTLLADDMGLGKTLQTITAILHWLKQEASAKFLIVCPASLIYNWKSEFEKFAPETELNIYHGAQRDFTAFLEQESSILITSYSIIRNDIDKFSNLNWDGIILDESHHIKNYQAQQTQAVLQLSGKRRLILNGTPIMNNVADLFPQLSFLLPQLFHSRKQFREQFEKPIQKSGSDSNLEALQKLTNPFILRRTKETAAPDLPSKTESTMWCELDVDQREAYETIKQQVKKNIFVTIDHQGVNKAKLGVLQGITKLRQVCSSPRLLKDEVEFQNTSSVKIDTLINTLTSTLKGKKVVVFSQFLGTMDLLKERFEKHAISYLSFSGQTSSKKRMELVEEYQQEDSPIQVFLLSLMAGNSGINLTNANYVFLVEPWWNKAVQQQAIDRVHRIGQNQNVFAYNMICKNTIEEKIVALQNKKQSLSDELISDDANFVKNLTEDDIAFLFE